MNNPTNPTSDFDPHGKILDHDAGTGEISGAEVTRRARELAMIAGRQPEDVNEGDRQQAVEELRGRRDQLAANDDPDFAAEMTERDSLTGGLTTPAGSMSDSDQTIGETLYNEGVAEATHDQMVQSRRGELRDQADEDNSRD